MVSNRPSINTISQEETGNSRGGTVGGNGVRKGGTKGSSATETKNKSRLRRKRKPKRQRQISMTSSGGKHERADDTQPAEVNETTEDNESKMKELQSAPEAIFVTPQSRKTIDYKSFSAEEVQKAREWFSALSGDDCIVALGFQDEDFLDTLFRAVRLLVGGDLVADRQAESIDWFQTLPSTFFGQEASRFATSRDDTIDAGTPLPAVSDDETDVDNMKVEEVALLKDEPSNESRTSTETGTAHPDEDEMEEVSVKDSDDLRIQGDTEPRGELRIRGADAQLLPDDEKSNDTVAESRRTHEEAGTGGKKDNVEDFLKKVSIVASSACDLLSTNHFDMSLRDATSPAISLHPSFFAEEGEVLTRFSNIMGSDYFLGGSIPKTWEGILWSLANGKDAATSLYGLLILRFQLAVIDSYMRAETRGVTFDISENSTDNVGKALMTRVEPTSLVTLLPTVFQRVVLLDEDGTNGAIWGISEFAKFLLKHPDRVSAVEQMVVITTRRIQEMPKSNESGTFQLKTSLDEPGAPADVAAEAPTATVNISVGENDFSAEGREPALDTSGKKTSRKRRKRKKKKGVAASTYPAGSDEVESSTETKLVKVDESTQTDEVVDDNLFTSPGVDPISIAEPAAAVELMDVAGSSSSVHSSKSVDSDDSSTAESPHKDEQSPQASNNSNDGLHLSRVEGVGTVVVTPSIGNETAGKEIESSGPASNSASPGLQEEDDHEDWETVEVRSRGNRKKGNERSNGGRFGALQSQNGNTTKKKAPRNPETRKRIQKRKMVREIIYSVLDKVHEQASKKRQQQQRKIQANTSQITSNVWGQGNIKSNGAPAVPSGPSGYQSQKIVEATGRGTSMRDILMGNSSGQTQHSSLQRKGGDYPKNTGEGGKRGSEKPTTGIIADQNTAPTLPETLSAVSTTSAITETRSARNPAPVPTNERGESSSNESLEATKPRDNSARTEETQLSPPLPTLLSPGNANSATSSVASSLEAPHAVHHNHLLYVNNENDVGYHLLRVCDRLTRDMENFMQRRQEALKLRRHERKLVLTALQDSLTTIWPGGCNVQMYGSCATDLDLPSSDLDVVVCGLDKSEKEARLAQVDSNMSEVDPETAHNVSDEGNGDASKKQATDPDSSPQKPSQQRKGYKLMTTNAERVMTLADDLERQPWAVHVKAIPTATVPVIKILADPSRLQADGDVAGDWLARQAQSDGSPGTDNMPWRGADVANGLLSVDITFEGPEHGGIGSTSFSKSVVKEFCKESGLPAESTAPVQVLMVLKEILAQRRLNEPFSGGLSSYALLLLVVSLVRERSIIRKELELVEHQRKLVASGGGSALPQSPSQQMTDKQSGGKSGKQKPSAQKQHTQDPSIVHGKVKSPGKAKVQEKNGAASISEGGEVSVPTSSWASIARKTSSTQLSKESEVGGTRIKAAHSKSSSPKKMGSFADAVAKGSKPETQSKSPKTKETAKIYSKADEINRDGKKIESQPAAQGKAISSKLPITAPIFEPNSSPSYNGSAPTKPNTSYGEEETSSFFPQSFHDVIEVLCTGETTPGKLLMHFLLFYGQHFDSHSTAIDYSNTHERDSAANNGYAVASPYMRRRNNGFYDPVAGIFTVDPIIIYDPLSGSETYNVARSCFAWTSIRWAFAQAYMTLSSAVEMSAGYVPDHGTSKASSPMQNPPGSTTVDTDKEQPSSQNNQEAFWGMPYRHDESGNVIFDPKAPLLELLLSF